MIVKLHQIASIKSQFDRYNNGCYNGYNDRKLGMTDFGEKRSEEEQRGVEG